MKKVALIVFVSVALSACQKASNIVIDSSQQIVNATHLTFAGKDSIDIASYINSHPPGLTITDTFHVTLNPVGGFSYLDVKVENDSTTILTEQSFSNLQGDSISGVLSFAPTSVYVGDLTYEFTPYGTNGTAGNYMVQTVHLYNSVTNPPVIDSVSVPDSIQVDPLYTVVADLYAKVQDPYGLTDISKVYFNSTRPDGTPATGNPYLMYDDGGASGAGGDDDVVAHDGVYTLGIQLPPTTTLGTYTFTFYAVNRSGVSSAPVSHNIRVYK